jgi:hypothetical protein
LSWAAIKAEASRTYEKMCSMSSCGRLLSLLPAPEGGVDVVVVVVVAIVPDRYARYAAM